MNLFSGKNNNNAMKSESGKEVQLFCSVVHEIVRPNQIDWRHHVARGREQSLDKYVIWKWEIYLLCSPAVGVQLSA